jgi:hypothetical protein
MWAYVVYLAFGPGRADSPDKLHDPAFAQAAESRCAAALADIDALPLASEFTGRPDERADEIAGINDELADMLGDLAATAPDGDDGRIVGLWLDDWQTFLADRRDYVDRLHDDDTARLFITEKYGRHITLAIDDFARINHMPSCVAPGDV